MAIHLFLSAPPSEPVQFFIMFIQLVLLIILLLFIHMGITYIKIAATTREHQRLFSILSESVLFLRRNLGKALILYGTLLLVLGLIMALYWLTSRIAGQLPTTVSILGLFLLQQSLSLTRSWYRLVGYASQMHLYVSNCK